MYKIVKGQPSPIETGEFISFGIQAKQITIDIDRDIMRVSNVFTLKRKKSMIDTTKDIPIIISKEKQMFDIFMAYYNTLQPDSFLFPITRQRCYVILAKVGLWCHFLRHLRLTNLAIEYGLNSQELRQFVNWATSATADNYIHLNIDDLIAKMKK